MYHVAYCFDKNFNQHFCAAVTSAILNFTKPQESLHFHLVTDTMDKELEQFFEALKGLFRCNFSIYVLADNERETLDRIPEPLRNLYHFSIAAYFRLLLPTLVPKDVTRLLYLDCDTIVIDDLSKLIDTDLEDKALGLVLDPKSEKYAKIHNISEYFNSGVALFDVQKWREGELTSKCFQYLENPLTPISQADQCAINVVLDGNIKKLEPHWNGFTYNVKNGDQPLQEVRIKYSIIHYFSQHKPWQSWYQNGLGRYYWTYLDASPWKHAKLVQPNTVFEHVWMAKKLEGEGRPQASNAVYARITDHFLSKR